jgi:pyruvate/2-oxoglutarate dehydrogenase complex dihydrolipoamide acyltransferase (E2) component
VVGVYPNGHSTRDRPGVRGPPPPKSPALLYLNNTNGIVAGKSASLVAEDYPVGTDYSGTITEQYVHTGDQVTAGQPLFEVQSSPAGSERAPAPDPRAQHGGAIGHQRPAGSTVDPDGAVGGLWHSRSADRTRNGSARLHSTAALGWCAVAIVMTDTTVSPGRQFTHSRSRILSARMRIKNCRADSAESPVHSAPKAPPIPRRKPRPFRSDRTRNTKAGDTGRDVIPAR